MKLFRKKKKSGLNKPKRAKTAYLFFCSDHRQKIKEKHPNDKVTVITKRLGKAWKNLNDKQKSK